MRNWCRMMHLDSWKSSLDLLARWHPRLRKQDDLDWVLEALRLRRCRRRFGLPASLIATLFAILCVAHLKYGSLKSLAAKPRIWSRRWRRCWGPSTGTPWWRPAWTWGPGSRLLLTLTAVLIKKMILDMYQCKFVLLQSNRMIINCAVSFESKKKKIPDLSMSPCKYGH